MFHSPERIDAVVAIAVRSPAEYGGSVNWEQLVEGVDLPFHPDLKVPALTEVSLPVPRPDPVGDVMVAARLDVVARFAHSVTPGMTIAVGGGSRGLTDRVALLKGVIAGLRELGAEPFVVPAMGSHGGATAEGQKSMLEHLGMTEEAIGAEIRATMDTVEVARTASGMPLYLDRNAAGADRILPVNRIKPHTCFKGPIESGCAKMAVVGFGKQPGAAQIHACGPVEMRNRILDGIAALRDTGRLLGGVASIESAGGEVVKVQALAADEVGGAVERELTDYARTLVPALPFPQIDVLVIERGGKDISGTTIDPNVTGRFWVHGLDDLSEPDASTIVLLDVTDVSGGNVLGIGFADFIPVSLAQKIDFRKTYINCFTAGIAGVRRSRMPMVLPSEDDCMKAALSMCGRAFDQRKRVVRIESTLHLTRCWVSDALLQELPDGASIVS
ncbi:MAG: lactate racemase domain-containing protein [Actinomycetota bacterium]